MSAALSLIQCKGLFRNQVATWLSMGKRANPDFTFSVRELSMMDIAFVAGLASEPWNYFSEINLVGYTDWEIHLARTAYDYGRELVGSPYYGKDKPKIKSKGGRPKGAKNKPKLEAVSPKEPKKVFEEGIYSHWKNGDLYWAVKERPIAEATRNEQILYRPLSNLRKSYTRDVPEFFKEARQTEENTTGQTYIFERIGGLVPLYSIRNNGPMTDDHLQLIWEFLHVGDTITFKSFVSKEPKHGEVVSVSKYNLVYKTGRYRYKISWHSLVELYKKV